MRSRATVVSLSTAIVLLTAPAFGLTASAADASGKRLPELVPSGRRDALAGALAAGRLSEAEYALERVRSLFALDVVRARFGDVDPPDPRSATILMRDLVLRLEGLSPADRAVARRILARPTDMGNDGPLGNSNKYSATEEPPLCDPHVCVHYVATSVDKPPPADESGVAGVPDHVEVVSDVLGDVWEIQIGEMGFRPPKSDDSSTNDGGDARLDVYLVDIGNAGLFGYCTSDDPHLQMGSKYRFWDASAYCVLDNDYSPAQYGYPNLMDPLTVTAAHEFFHAVQFAYDFAEDVWLLESTATWIEDELFDGVNDNRSYLPFSPLRKPTVPLDKSVHPRWYGAWIFWRFLAEFFGGASSDPTIVRAVWRRADGSGPTRPD
ncbi:MAG: MXAN_6640 family putative metalloprotease, partial [Gemmatimonadota bacterium]